MWEALPAAIPEVALDDGRSPRERVSHLFAAGGAARRHENLFSLLRQLSQERISSLQVQTEILGNGLSRICQAGSRAQVGTLRNA